MHVVTFATTSAHPSDAAALAFLLDAAGIPARQADHDESADVLHGHASARGAAIHIPLRPGTPDWRRLAEIIPAGAIAGGSMAVDIVTATRVLLDDDWPGGMPADALDPHGRLRADSAHASTMSATSDPLVNRLVAIVADACARTFGIKPEAPWPDGCRAALGLSHDVDRPQPYAALNDLWRPWRLRKAPRTRLRLAMRLAREWVTDPSRDDHWAFEELLDVEARLGVRSTFLFSVTPHHARHGSSLDPAYDASAPRFRRLFARLRDVGAEVGLHASYRAFEVPERLAEERRRLAEIANADVSGVRHHYWQLGPDSAATLRGHEAAGFEYDASIGFNDAPGFRRGVALPFHVYDHSLGRPLRVLEMPTTLMDGSLHYRSMSSDTASAAAIEHVERVREHRGLAVVDWHSHTSVTSNRRFSEWGETYGRLLQWSVSQPDLWVAPLGEIARWRTERSRRLQAVGSAAPS